MADHLATWLLAAGPGAMIGLLALGLIIVYRSSNVLNLAHPMMATLGAYAYYELAVVRDLPLLVSVLGAAVGVGVASVVVYLLAMRPLAKASPLTKLVASVGVLMIVQSALLLKYGSLYYVAPSLLPQSSVDLPGDAQVGLDRLCLVGLAIALTVALWALYRWSRFGVETSAFAENPLVSRVFGLRTARLALGNWFLGGFVAGLAGALLAPVTGLSVTQMSALLVPVLAAAIVGSLTSFPLALLGGIGIAVVQAEVSAVTTRQGAADLVPFLVILLLMLVRGQAIPIRSAVGLRLPGIGSGRINPVLWGVLTVGAIVSLHTWFPYDLLRPLLINLVFAIILLSVVVVTGYAGQVSLAQFALAGFGAFVCGSLMADRGWAFVPAAIVGVVLCMVVGALAALPALRMRGVSLAVITLGVSVVLFSAAFNRSESIIVEPPSLFGIDLGMITHPRNYLTLAVVALSISLLIVGNLRRSGTGLRMIAIRGNERAAASMGINVAATKIVAFTISSGIAAVGGILLAYQTPVITFVDFDPFGSAEVLAWVTIGGSGYLLGPVIGSMLAHGSLGTEIGESIYNDTAVLGIAGGIILVLTLVMHPDGFASLGDHLRHLVDKKRGRRSVARPVVEAAEPLPPGVGRTLRVADVSMAFGGVKALSDVSFDVRPGQVHGLIGSNGAGKTTLLDVISGFVSPRSGSVHLEDDDLTRTPTWRRARLGFGRSFQNVQLFPDLTVLDNLRVASVADGRSVWRDLFWPGRQRVSRAVWAAIQTLELEDELDKDVDSLTHGKRQLISIARALAAAPSFVLLDEPAAGLDEVERDELSKLLRRLARELNIGILLVEHDVELVMGVCDWVTVLHQGRVIARGEAATVRTDPAVLEAYLGGGTPDASETTLDPAEVG